MCRVLSLCLRVLLCWCLLSSCAGGEIPPDYVASCTLGEDTGSGPLAVPAEEDCQILYIYRDKRVILVDCSYDSEGNRSETAASSVRLDAWTELSGYAMGTVMMAEGDVATFTPDQFIAYMETIYP